MKSVDKVSGRCPSALELVKNCHVTLRGVNEKFTTLQTREQIISIISVQFYYLDSVVMSGLLSNITWKVFTN